MIRKILEFLVRKPQEQERIEQWLADSASLADLERRQRMIDKGQAPWQIQANNNLRGWA